jgi:hypothetical protein
MRAREWIETRKAINDLVRMEREIERLIEGNPQSIIADYVISD